LPPFRDRDHPEKHLRGPRSWVCPLAWRKFLYLPLARAFFLKGRVDFRRFRCWEDAFDAASDTKIFFWNFVPFSFPEESAAELGAVR
jgi:hypothetical protein